MPSFKNMINGLQLIANYVGEHTFLGGAEHDVLYASNCTMTEEDKKLMDEWGWHYDEENECWARFV